MRLRFIAALLSPFLTGFYAAFLTYFFRDPASPFGFEKEYLLGLIFSFVLNFFLFIWVSIAVDRIANHLRLVKVKGYIFKAVSYAIAGYLPVILIWLRSSNPHAALFYPKATFFPVASLLYLHVMLALESCKRSSLKGEQE